MLSPNGAGKTTLVRQVTTELLPTSGRIHVFGMKVVREPDSVINMMGIMPLEAVFFWDLTVHQTFRIFGKLRGQPPKAASRRANEVIDELMLAQHPNVPI